MKATPSERWQYMISGHLCLLPLYGQIQIENTCNHRKRRPDHRNLIPMPFSNVVTMFSQLRSQQLRLGTYNPDLQK